MTDAKWTPGPWRMESVFTTCGMCHRIGPFPRPDYASKGEGWACVYDDYPPGNGSVDLLANAHLIAAAPELYEALKDVLRSARKDFGPGLKGETQFKDAYREAFAALAKARGESA